MTALLIAMLQHFLATGVSRDDSLSGGPPATMKQCLADGQLADKKVIAQLHKMMCSCKNWNQDEYRSCDSCGYGFKDILPPSISQPSYESGLCLSALLSIEGAMERQNSAKEHNNELRQNVDKLRADCAATTQKSRGMLQLVEKIARYSLLDDPAAQDEKTSLPAKIEPWMQAGMIQDLHVEYCDSKDCTATAKLGSQDYDPSLYSNCSGRFRKLLVGYAQPSRSAQFKGLSSGVDSAFQSVIKVVRDKLVSIKSDLDRQQDCT
ncbi:MAG: hypothetical protein ACRERD_05390, partial [Candidatus Binatia bacterium]